MESGLLCLFPSKHLRNCFARVLLFHPILVESATQRFFNSVFQQAQTFALTAVNGENFEVINLRSISLLQQGTFSEENW